MPCQLIIRQEAHLDANEAYTYYEELHDKGSVRLQGHGSAVSFRHIWIREI